MNVKDWDEDYDYCSAKLEDVHFTTLRELFGERESFGGKLGWSVQTLNGWVTLLPDYSKHEDEVTHWYVASDSTGTSDDPGAAVGEVLETIRSEAEHRELAHRLAVSKAAERAAKINEGLNRRLAEQ